MIMRVRLGVVGCMCRDAEDGVNGCCTVRFQVLGIFVRECPSSCMVDILCIFWAEVVDYGSHDFVGASGSADLDSLSRMCAGLWCFLRLDT